MARRALWLLGLTGVVVPASLGIAADAEATVGCTFGAPTAAITADAANNTAIVGRSVSIPLDAIEVNGSQCGGTATLTNTDTIAFTDTSGSNTSFIVGLGNGPLEPGATDEPGGSDEIELTAAFGSGGNEFDLLEVDGCGDLYCTSANDHIVWGTGGINLNANEALGDVDLTSTGAEVYRAHGSTGNDTLAGDGGFGTGVTTSTKLEAIGGPGMDFLTGGAGVDSLSGEADNDVLVGGQANDNLSPGPGDDQLSGEGGAFDIANFSQAASGISVDLSITGAQNTGEGSDLLLDVESIVGSAFDDPQLAGNDAPNNINGLSGSDVISGAGGDDSLSGSEGNDRIQGGSDDIVGDDVSGGEGTDTADYSTATAVTVNLGSIGPQLTGGGGLDELTGIENLIGSPEGDDLRGAFGPNVLKGGGGPDTIKDIAGKDRVKGGDGADVLNGGGGKDTVRGGKGPDEVKSKDGRKDIVVCGPGHDTVTAADAKDKLKGCEVVP